MASLSMLIVLVWFGGEFGNDMLALLPLCRQKKKIELVSKRLLEDMPCALDFFSELEEKNNVQSV